MKLNSHDRIIRMLKGEQIDRVAIMPFDSYEIEKIMNSDSELMFAEGRAIDTFTNGWKKNDQRYADLLSLCRENEIDIIHRTSFPEFDRRFLLVPPQFISMKELVVDDETIRRNYKIKTPKGELTYIEELRKNISTTWILKPLISNREEALKMLSVPYEFHAPDITNFENEREELGDRGVISSFVSDPLVCVSHMLRFDQFLSWILEERILIDQLVETAYERIYRVLEYLLRQGIGQIIEFGGSEQATPPMMSPNLFDDFVVKYDGQLIKLVKTHGQFVRVHCHGKVRDVLPKFQRMGVDMINPMEAPPHGDINIGAARKLVNSDMVLEGNIQYQELEVKKEVEIEESVKMVIEASGKDRFVLEPTEWPISPLGERLARNYRRFILSGLRFGQLQNKGARVIE